jgi:hypothetical protein
MTETTYALALLIVPLVSVAAILRFGVRPSVQRIVFAPLAAIPPIVPYELLTCFCDQGRQSPLLGCASALLVAVFLKSRLWVLVMVATITGTVYFLGLQYGEFVHRGDNVTGNTAWASGSFWHSSFSNLYPKKQEFQGTAENN